MLVLFLTLYVLTSSFSGAQLPAYFSRDRLTDELQNTAHLILEKEHMDTLKRIAATHKKMRKYDEMMNTLKIDPLWRPSKKKHWEDLKEMSYLNDQLEGFHDKLSFIRNHLLWRTLKDPFDYAAAHPRQVDNMIVDTAHRNWEVTPYSVTSGRQGNTMNQGDGFQQSLTSSSSPHLLQPDLQSQPQPHKQQSATNLPLRQPASPYLQYPPGPAMYPPDPNPTAANPLHTHPFFSHLQSGYPPPAHPPFVTPNQMQMGSQSAPAFQQDPYGLSSSHHGHSKKKNGKSKARHSPSTPLQWPYMANPQFQQQQQPPGATMQNVDNSMAGQHQGLPNRGKLFSGNWNPEEQLISEADYKRGRQKLAQLERQQAGHVANVVEQLVDKASQHSDRLHQLQDLPAWRSLQNTDRETTAELRAIIKKLSEHKKKLQDVKEAHKDMGEVSELQEAVQNIFDHQQKLERLENKLIELVGFLQR